ncbi:MAG: LPS assembly lipoprotein LptE [Wenzhouxiangella sp.]|nr:LPS assembly lipoprotein LptE [Wenzhouxiangella sp.]
MARPVAAIWAIVVILLGSTGCGFQLRGEARLPEIMDQTWLVVPDKSSEFARELALRLEGEGVTLTDGAEDGVATLRIHAERLRTQPLTISGQARVREFQLVFDLEFELLDGEGEVLIQREALRLSRDYSFDEQAILAASREEEFLRDDLRRSMAAMLIRRLEAAPSL